MVSFEKLSVFLLVSFCILQITLAKAIGKRLLEDVEIALKKVSSKVDYELDLEKTNVEHKLKLRLDDTLKQDNTNEVKDCVKKHWFLTKETVMSITNKGKDCIRTVNGEMDSALIEKDTVDDIDDFKTNFKKKLQKCKTRSTEQFKPIVKQFFANAKTCEK